MPVLAESRRRAIGELVRGSGAVTVAEVESRFGVSSMTARRDLDALERHGIVRRTHGGAVLPEASAHETSFAQRVDTHAAAKRALAADAVELVAPGETIFLDASSTVFYVARRLVESGVPLTVLTNSLPVMRLVSAQAAEQVELICIGGALRRLTSSFVGPTAIDAIRRHYADRLFFSIKGLAEDGTLTDADPLEAEVKRAMIERSGTSLLLLDRSKLAVRGLNAIGPIGAVDGVIAHGIAASDLDALRSSAPTVRVTGAGSA